MTRARMSHTLVSPVNKLVCVISVASFTCGAEGRLLSACRTAQSGDLPDQGRADYMLDVDCSPLYTVLNMTRALLHHRRCNTSAKPSFIIISTTC